MCLPSTHFPSFFVYFSLLNFQIKAKCQKEIFNIQKIFPTSVNTRKLIFWFPLHFYPPTCRWHLVSRDRSLSRLLALSFWGLLGWRSFSDVLLPRLPANFGSCLKAKTAKEERDKLNNSLHSDMKNHACAFTALSLHA